MYLKKKLRKANIYNKHYSVVIHLRPKMNNRSRSFFFIIQKKLIIMIIVTFKFSHDNKFNVKLLIYCVCNMLSIVYI